MGIIGWYQRKQRGEDWLQLRMMSWAIRECLG